MSIKQKLARLKGHKTTPPHQEETAIPFLEEWRAWGAEPVYFDGDYCFVREVVYSLDTFHGNYRLGEFHDVHHLWQTTALSHPLSSKGHKASDLFFFDTETTGLGSGTGNTIFLLGHARVYDDRVVVRQHILPHPGAEIALYQSFLSEVDYTTLVTYNGKAFDWPVVQTRHTLIREALPKLPSFGHFDLYHASRRIWKQRLSSVRLACVEKEILGVERKEDIPGFLAPMMYFEFLSTKHPETIGGVLKHNEMDIVSLIVLYIHLSKQILQAEKIAHAPDKFEMARWFDTLGEVTEAKKVYEQVAESNRHEAMQAKWNLSLLYKKEKDYSKATAIWEELFSIGQGRWKIQAAIELAKLYEHRFRDPKRAYHYAEEAYRLQKILGRLSGQSAEEMKKRLDRLMRKITK